jgi:hypothetical protein
LRGGKRQGITEKYYEKFTKDFYCAPQRPIPLEMFAPLPTSFPDRETAW